MNIVHLSLRLFLNDHSCVASQFHFQQHFNVGQRGHVPSHNTFLLWVNNFRGSGSALKCKSTGSPRSARTQEIVERVRQAVKCSPYRPARKHVAAMHLSGRSLR